VIHHGRWWGSSFQVERSLRVIRKQEGVKRVLLKA